MLLTLEIEELEARIAPGLVCEPTDGHASASKDDHGSKAADQGSKGHEGSKGNEGDHGSKEAHAGSKDDSGTKCA